MKQLIGMNIVPLLKFFRGVQVPFPCFWLPKIVGIFPEGGTSLRDYENGRSTRSNKLMPECHSPIELHLDDLDKGLILSKIGQGP